MLTYNMSARNGVAIYEYLYRCIREDIIAGRLAPGEHLPSKRTLADHLDISVVSVENAYSQLLNEGYITAQQRRGYFVAAQSRQHAALPDAAGLPEESEQEDYVLDFKANRISLSLFPSTAWSRYMREALSSDNSALLRPIPFNGLPELRSAIASYLRSHTGMAVNPARIIIGAGTEYLYSRLLQLFDRSSVLALEDPGYKKFGTIADSYGIRTVFVPIDTEGVQVDRLEASGANLAHVSPANQFPTGLIMQESRREELFRWAEQAEERYIIEDDYDSEFRYTGAPTSPMFGRKQPNKVIYINTFSKTLVPSIRISYMILPEPLFQRYKKTMSFYSCTVSSFEQYALARLISTGHFDRHINRLRSHYREVRLLTMNALAASPLSRISRVREHNAGTHFLLSVHTDMTEEEIARRGLAEGIQMSFFSEYCFNNNPHAGSRMLVFNYAGITRENVDFVIRKLERIFLEP